MKTDQILGLKEAKAQTQLADRPSFITMNGRAVVEGKFIRVNRIRSHAGYFCWLSDVNPTGEYLARVQTEDIPSPYAYSPSVTVYDWRSIPVVVFETSHKVYDVFSIPTNLLKFKTDDKATDWHIKYSRESPSVAKSSL